MSDIEELAKRVRHLQRRFGLPPHTGGDKCEFVKTIELRGTTFSFCQHFGCEQTLIDTAS